MSTDHTHLCVYFDEGELELVCVCGSRAIEVDGVLVALEAETFTVTFRPTAGHRELAASA